MRLILMRHGEAAALVSDDASRPLTLRGQQQAASTAQQLIQQYQPDLFIVSPLLRAQQTCQAFLPYCANVPVVTYPHIKPDDRALPALSWLTMQEAQCIVVVCHMNIVAYMAGLLLEQQPESFALAEARVFEQVVIAPGLSTEKKRFLPKDGQ